MLLVLERGEYETATDNILRAESILVGLAASAGAPPHPTAQPASDDTGNVNTPPIALRSSDLPIYTDKVR